MDPAPPPPSPPHARTVPALPLEICEHILDHLWDARGALRAAALVCRAWAPAARFHLFGTLHVASREAGAAARAQLAALPAVAPRVRTLVLRDFRAADLLAVLPAVVRVVVRAPADHSPCALGGAEGDARAPGAGEGAAAGDRKGEKERTAEGMCFPGVRTLELERKRVQWADLQRMLAMFPALARLRLRDVVGLKTPYAHFLRERERAREKEKENAGARAGSAGAVRLHVPVLSVAGVDADTVALLLDGLSAPQIERMEVALGAPADVDWLVDALAAPRALEHLAITYENRMRWDGAFVSRLRAASVPPNAMLRSLELTCRYTRWMESTRAPTHDVLPLLLAHVHRAHALAALTLRLALYMYDTDDFAAIDWRALDAHLARAARARPQLVVRLVVLNSVNYPGWTADAMEFVAPRFPRMRAAGAKFGVRCERGTECIRRPTREMRERWF